MSRYLHPSVAPAAGAQAGRGDPKGPPLVPGGGPLHGGVPGFHGPGRLGWAGASAAALTQSGAPASADSQLSPGDSLGVLDRPGAEFELEGGGAP